MALVLNTTDHPKGREPSSPGKIYLSSLKLTNFRNYDELTLRLDSRPVVLTGPNGAGKTNLLEAISFLSPGRGLRRARLADLGRRDGDGSWAVATTLAGPDGETDIGTGLVFGNDGPASPRAIRINHAPAPGSRTLLDHLRVVWLTPAMDGLFTGPAADRRRFLDRLVLAIDRRHGERVASYENAMRGRNRLLEENHSDVKWLDAIEAQMAEFGVAVAAARKECIALLSKAISATSHDQTFPAAQFGIAGTVEEALDTASATEVEDQLIRAFSLGRPADRAARRTLSGTHLSDLKVTHAPKQTLAAECSTGEQKALLVGIILAHAGLIARMNGEMPLLLMDEIGAHLDSTIRADLLGILLGLGFQVWLTGTEPGPFSVLGDAAQHICVSDGTVKVGATLG